MVKDVGHNWWEALAKHISMLMVLTVAGFTLLAASSPADKVDSLKSILKASPIKDTVYLQQLIQLGILIRNENVEESNIS